MDQRKSFFKDSLWLNLFHIKKSNVIRFPRRIMKYKVYVEKKWHWNYLQQWIIKCQDFQGPVILNIHVVLDSSGLYIKFTMHALEKEFVQHWSSFQLYYFAVPVNYNAHLKEEMRRRLGEKRWFTQNKKTK